MRLVVFWAIALLVLPSPLNAAYIDPLSGSVILQVIAAGVLAVSFTVKNAWRTLLRSIGDVWKRATRR